MYIYIYILASKVEFHADKSNLVLQRKAETRRRVSLYYASCPEVKAVTKYIHLGMFNLHQVSEIPATSNFPPDDQRPCFRAEEFEVSWWFFFVVFFTCIIVVVE